MLCTIGMRNCVVNNRQTRTEGYCLRCGFNLDEYNRRIADIRAHGLERVGKDRYGTYVWGYRVKHGPPKGARYDPDGTVQTETGGTV